MEKKKRFPKETPDHDNGLSEGLWGGHVFASGTSPIWIGPEEKAG